MTVVKIFTHYHQRAPLFCAVFQSLVRKTMGTTLPPIFPAPNKRLTHFPFDYTMFRFLFVHSSSFLHPGRPFTISFRRRFFPSLFFNTHWDRIIMWILLSLANNNDVHNRRRFIGILVCLFLCGRNYFGICMIRWVGLCVQPNVIDYNEFLGEFISLFI